MNTQLIYIIFSVVIVLALILDLGLLSKKNAVITSKAALVQTIFWVLLSCAFGGFIWFVHGKEDAVKYISAYLLEWSLSIDNIFCFYYHLFLLQGKTIELFAGLITWDSDGNSVSDSIHCFGQ